MRTPLLLILSAYCAIVHAQPVHRCGDADGHALFTDRPCATPLDASIPARDPTSIAYAAVVDEAAAAAQARLEQQLLQRRLLALREERADTLHFRQLLKQSDERLTLQHGENRLRCEKALRIAALCGSIAEGFSCTARGFSTTPAPAGGGIAVPGGRRQHEIEQCARRAAMGEAP